MLVSLYLLFFLVFEDREGKTGVRVGRWKMHREKREGEGEGRERDRENREKGKEGRWRRREKGESEPGS